MGYFTSPEIMMVKIYKSLRRSISNGSRVPIFWKKWLHTWIPRILMYKKIINA